MLHKNFVLVQWFPPTRVLGRVAISMFFKTIEILIRYTTARRLGKQKKDMNRQMNWQIVWYGHSKSCWLQLIINRLHASTNQYKTCKVFNFDTWINPLLNVLKDSINRESLSKFLQHHMLQAPHKNFVVFIFYNLFLSRSSSHFVDVLQILYFTHSSQSF